MTHRVRPLLYMTALAALAVSLVSTTARAADAPAPVKFEYETLDNGLRVIYAPLDNAPVVHVRVLYHVGSRDERPDRQGFAHMFEHMMFRGSEHVDQEEHMKLIMQVGGSSNAFTSYDQTTYVNTIPSNQLAMALYLEADRMASFKVSEEIFKTERNVVNEEWRLRTANPPYGTFGQDFAKLGFQKHSYRWTPIGDMDQLAQSTVAELQEFFNTYYVPNNACLIIAGDIDVDEAKAMVRKYYGWIPKGAEVPREIPAEPEPAEARRLVEFKTNIPVPALQIGFKTAEWSSDDHYALDMLAAILGRGRTSRLNQLLVNGAEPKCSRVMAGSSQLQDPGMFSINARLLPRADVDEVEQLIFAAIDEIVQNGVTAEELERAKLQRRIRMLRGRDTATSLATLLGNEAVFGGDPNRVNEEWAKIDALTVEDVQSVARKYLQPQRSVVLQYRPQRNGIAEDPPQDDAERNDAAPAAAPVAPPAPASAEPRQISFPQDYPKRPPISDEIIRKTFEKGVEADVNGVKVIVLEDNRLPLVNWTLTMRSGGHSEPKGKEGVAGMTAGLMRRGAADLDFLELSRDLEARGISVEVSDGGDVTRISGSSLTDQLDHGMTRTRQILLEPAFNADEFAKAKQQAAAMLMQALSNPGGVAGRELSAALWGDSPFGRNATLESINAITLDDVRNWYSWVYKPNDAILVFSGDITPERGKELAEKLLADWKKADTIPTGDYRFPPAPSSRKIILVDNPTGQQATIRLAIRAYDNQSDDKYPGALAGRILSEGIQARLGRYLRAEKGLTYGARGTFSPGRHGGSFGGSVDTNPNTTAEAIAAMFKVFNDLRAEPPTDVEMAEAKQRTAGSMVMQMQTIDAQADRRVDQILNGYPIDYFDNYPQRIAEVSAEQVREVMDKYVKDDAMVIVVVAPAEQVKSQLDALGAVEVMPMPAGRPAMRRMMPAAEEGD